MMLVGFLKLTVLTVLVISYVQGNLIPVDQDFDQDYGNVMEKDQCKDKVNFVRKSLRKFTFSDYFGAKRNNLNMFKSEPFKTWTE